MNALKPLVKPDGRQSETAAMVQKGVCRHLRQAGFATLCEFTLGSGRRADVVALNHAGRIWIVCRSLSETILNPAPAETKRRGGPRVVVGQSPLLGWHRCATTALERLAPGGAGGAWLFFA